MGFIVDVEKKKKKKPPKKVKPKEPVVVPQPVTRSFMEFMQAERETIRNRLNTLHELRSELNRLQLDYTEKKFETDDFVVSRKNKAKSLVVQKQAEIDALGEVITLETFDTRVAPFLDLYYKRSENNVTEDYLIDLFQNQFNPHENCQDPEIISPDECESCGESMVCSPEEASLYCPVCGDTKNYLDCTSSNIAYGEDVDYTSFAYKRINHLNEFLNHFQAKETSPVPMEILEKVMKRLYEKKIRDPSAVNFSQVKDVLKELGTRKYYDQTMQIWCRITGKQPLRLDPVVEEKLRLLFVQIQTPFEKHCPPSRKNFLSYPYCMYKFCQLLKYHNLLPYLSLLKGKDKLELQEEIFKKICGELGWPFIPL